MQKTINDYYMGKNKKKTYQSPEVETMEMTASQMICGSYDGSSASMDWADDNGTNWQ